MKDSVTFWGTGDSMGVPRVYCSCDICDEARGAGSNRRYRSSIMLHAGDSELLVDCGPDWRGQMERAGKRFVERVLITHAHFDHIGGLPEWADACRWLKRKGRLYAPLEVLQTIQKQFPWLQNQLQFHDCAGGLQWEHWRIRPWRVCHGKNGYSYAYRFERTAGPSYAFVYCPDSIRLSDEEKAPLFGLQLLILGTNFYKEEAAPATRSVYDMVEALELISEISPGRVIFTHMSHGVDLARSYPLPSFVSLAQTGLTIELEPS
ncbi:MBL fold metallo-hydrolase [Paenibacillus doosanensis]|uniref:Hydrolase n=1 Tax=Paenibacillus konkukensis TaxID=2020716 RepID=A0ABY4RRN6_9BACL|nr:MULTISPECIES: MBL fold metallo-hydrolase [Paenibacillus]MCS7462055.1 MBL fold metallo-hydrolase [Paenibacillus doosanensis]UQZ85122.1 putative hydrolase [Paenibacillus konkukensis]